MLLKTPATPAYKRKRGQGMASNSIGFSDATSALTFVDDSTAGSSLSGGVARPQLVGDVAGDATG